MAERSRVDALVATLALLASSAILVAGLSSFGIWDPWEIDVAERVRAHAAPEGAPLRELAMRAAFDGLGVHEWTGRLPSAIAGVLTLLFVFALGARSGGTRVGAYGALVAATTPLLLFNARTMIGDALPMAAQAGLGLTLFGAVFPGQPRRAGSDASARRTTLVTALYLALAAGFTVAAVASAGLLRGALPPLLAVAVLAVLDGRPARRSGDARDAAAWVVLVAAIAATAGAVAAVAADRAGYSAVLGGAPSERAIGSFEAIIETVLHGFAPWSALLLAALAHAIEPRVEVEGPGAAATLEGARHRLALFCVLWVAAGYVVSVVHDARYGEGAYLPVAALALVVATFLVSVEESQRPFPFAAIVAAILAGLLLRDFRLYPERPLAVLAGEGLSVPDDPQRKIAFALALGGFAGACVVSLGFGPSTRPLALAAPYRFLRDKWDEGPVAKLWLLGIAAVLVFFAVFGGACLAFGDRLAVGSLAVRVGKGLFFVPAALPLVVALAQVGAYVVERLGPLRLAPLLLAGLACGAYFGHGYLSGIGEQYSSREIYGAWNELRGEHDELMMFGVQARSGAYYAEGPVREARNGTEVAEYLAGSTSRRWAAFARPQLGRIDAKFRERANRHLVVARASNDRTVLVTNLPIEGERDENPLATSVRTEPPANVDRRTDIRFGESVELVGYDLELPRSTYVGPGEHFVVTWYWRVRQRIAGGYQIFVHIDGPGGRINADHAPAGGAYPVSMWQPGDVVVDRQEIPVPAHVTSGEYTIYLGLWSGPNRLPVTVGEEDGADRAIAGKLQIR